MELYKLLLSAADNFDAMGEFRKAAKADKLARLITSQDEYFDDGDYEGDSYDDNFPDDDSPLEEDDRYDYEPDVPESQEWEDFERAISGISNEMADSILGQMEREEEETMRPSKGLGKSDKASLHNPMDDALPFKEKNPLYQHDENTEDTDSSLDHFRDMIDHHDWYYQFTDDFNAWKRGSESEEKIEKTLKEIKQKHPEEGKEAQRIFDQKINEVNSNIARGKKQ